MKLSIVIICWNDLKVIQDCLESIYGNRPSFEFEVIISDNGSTDGSIELIRQRFPEARIVENRANLGFARGNNAGIEVSRGEFVLILNPDTIIHPGSLDRWIEFADRHPEAGGFGCRVLNRDGSYQQSARPFPTLARDLIAALYLRPLAYVSDAFVSDEYLGWKGDTEREVEWQSGCCVMFRGELLKRLNGFDSQFFYHLEEVDLCKRGWESGHPILFTPAATITHLGGQSVSRFPIRFELEKYRGRYKYFYKHFGRRAARRLRRVVLIKLRVRELGYSIKRAFRPGDVIDRRLSMYRVCLEWNKQLDPVRFVENGEEPDVRAFTSGTSNQAVAS
jgi:GT2 family glycosyltransferase